MLNEYDYVSLNKIDYSRETVLLNLNELKSNGYETLSEHVSKVLNTYPNHNIIISGLRMKNNVDELINILLQYIERKNKDTNIILLGHANKYSEQLSDYFNYYQ